MLTMIEKNFNNFKKKKYKRKKENRVMLTVTGGDSR